MVLNWFTSVAIKAALEWLLSLLVRFKEHLEAVEKGRQEVKDALDKKQAEANKELETIRNSDTTFDAAVDKLRNRASGK